MKEHNAVSCMDGKHSPEPPAVLLPCSPGQSTGLVSYGWGPAKPAPLPCAPTPAAPAPPPSPARHTRAAEPEKITHFTQAFLQPVSYPGTINPRAKPSDNKEMSEMRTLIKILICSPHSPLARVTHGVIAHFVTQPPAFLQGFLPLSVSNRAAGTEAAAVLKPLPSFAAGAKGDAGAAGGGQDRAVSAEPDPPSLGTLGHHLSHISQWSSDYSPFSGSQPWMQTPGCLSAARQVKVPSKLYVRRKTRLSKQTRLLEIRRNTDSLSASPHLTEVP